MGTRGFVSVAVLKAAGALLLSAVILAERHNPPAAAPEGTEETVASGPAVQGPPDWALNVLDKTADGNWVVSWAAVTSYLGQYTFDPDLGEKNHRMYGTTSVTASIFPVSNVWKLDANKLFLGHIVARIESSDTYPQLGLIKGSNYLYVWRSGKRGSRMAVLNESGRRELHHTYVRHGEVTSAMARDVVNGRSRNPGGLSIAALTCIAKGWKACFVDSRDAQSLADDAGPGMMGLLEAQGGGGSQPWVACVLYGCCCGGTQCHKN